MQRTLGTCYYPEQWTRDIWEEDARRMAEAGLTWVRIGEFAWSRLEPQPGQYDFDWLDDAITVLGAAGLKVVLGTPTATPPRWLVDRYPDMLAVDAEGRPRKFGSRRHYCFSHAEYKAECARIVTKLAERYGKNPHVAAWQTDNEYGCHDTIISYSGAARAAFRTWLRGQYPGPGNDGDIGALNAAWGNVFWSMEYDGFDQIDLPNLTVTEPNPAHVLAFRRFSSDQVVAFNRVQTDILRAHSSAPLSHNYMGRITDFDHFKVGADLDIATWDSYPLGFLEDRVGADPARQRAYARQGDPDFQAFHHDLYRAVAGCAPGVSSASGKPARWWVMEQQPGPVNWAPYNPAPLPGMVRLWSWEAFAHGAEAVCYFRWRQAPFAQEQMHSGLLRPDNVEAPGLDEARQVFAELKDAPEVPEGQAAVALIFDYDADFAWATQPHGLGLSYFGLVFDTYRAMRGLGLSVDILPPGTTDFAGYKVIAAPGLMHMSDGLKSALVAADAQVLIGPRSGARDEDMAIPLPLPPDIPGLDVTVAHVESLRPDMPIALADGGHVQLYREALQGSAAVAERAVDGTVAAMTEGQVTYLGAWLDESALQRLLAKACTAAGVETMVLPDGVRRRDCGDERFWFNYTAQPVTIEDWQLEAAGVRRQSLTRT
ncbi:beta-galactosidase [Marinovum sp. 2_MG-2023]|uniref:beta-galactosidase n=1 Tax=unclassified Marinovum TaxID=2647166 RepID=UPI0026E21E64|nr:MULTISPECIES: beta-galactosidase [unclassified Marinovum]MDO6730995.1 beta-galactosidase [Marinovum sp. 2_MG-2023]MDO6780222.1 beta-galactosidase [Marinovum sp. 1_MG-2023]